MLPCTTDEVALLLGPPGKRRIGFASVRNGVLRREIPVPGGNATAAGRLLQPPNHLLRCSSDTVYAMPESGGPPVRLTEGEDLTIDPQGRMLLVQTSRGMVRVHLPSAAAEPIVLPSGVRLATGNIPHRPSTKRDAFC